MSHELTLSLRAYSALVRATGSGGPVPSSDFLFPVVKAHLDDGAVSVDGAVIGTPAAASTEAASPAEVASAGAAEVSPQAGFVWPRAFEETPIASGTERPTAAVEYALVHSISPLRMRCSSSADATEGFQLADVDARHEAADRASQHSSVAAPAEPEVSAETTTADATAVPCTVGEAASFRAVPASDGDRQQASTREFISALSSAAGCPALALVNSSERAGCLDACAAASRSVWPAQSQGLCSPDSTASTNVTELMSTSPRLSQAEIPEPGSDIEAGMLSLRFAKRGRSCGALSEVGRRKARNAAGSAARLGGARWRQRSRDGLAFRSSTRLEQTLRLCKKGLERAEQDAVSVGAAGSCDANALTELSQNLEDLAVESFQCGCSRDVPGAMDVFEETQELLSRMGDLLSAQLSSGAPRSAAECEAHATPRKFATSSAASTASLAFPPDRQRAASPIPPRGIQAPEEAEDALHKALLKVAPATAPPPAIVKTNPKVFTDASCFGGMFQAFSEFAKNSSVASVVKHWTA